MSPSPMDSLHPPFRAEHLGSLKRPQSLLNARAKFDKGEIDYTELEKVEDEAIRDIVKMQQRVGLKTITDGEFRRVMFYDGLFDSIEGFTRVVKPDPSIFTDWLPHMAAFKAGGDWAPVDTYLCTGKIACGKTTYAKWFRFVAGLVDPEEVKHIKMTMGSPEWFHFRTGEGSYTPDAYSNEADFFADLAKAYRGQLEALYEAGCRNVQMDVPLLTAFCTEHTPAALKKDGIEPDALLETYIKLYKDCLREKKPDMVVGMHLCRGNFKGGKHFYEGSYDYLATNLFHKLDMVDCWYLEYDTQRAGGFEPLRKFPKDKKLVLGLISTKTPVLECKAAIKASIDSVAQLLDDPEKERICLSPQCGFASHMEGNPVTDKDMEKKLALIVEIAKEVWGTAA